MTADWQGYWLTTTVHKPWLTKMNAIIALQAPVNVIKVCLIF